jgi:hypothetical protein
VRTLLNSGNAVFISTGRSTARHSKLVGAALLVSSRVPGGCLGERLRAA